MLERYGEMGCPAEYPVRAKCIALFQKIHGVDTLLYAVYVYEYGQECAAPNRRRVYISYLDSVQYFEPKCYRTIAYHSVLVEYLRYVKNRGFHTAHIWSCPPTASDDYIFYSHPEHQCVPRDDMLRAWYHRMLNCAKAEGVVLRTTTLYDEYFVKDGLDSVPWSTSHPNCLPYFEGDYIPGEIENIIRHGKENGGFGSSDPTTDYVMARLGHNLNKMKDNFIVVHLRSRRFAASVERGDDVLDWKEDSDEEIVRSKRAKISGKDSSVLYDHSKDGAKDKNLEVLTSDAQAPNSSDGDGLAGSQDGSESAKKRGFDEIKPALSRHFGDLNRSLKVVGDTSDVDEPMEIELFEARQRFLNYCQTTHCQFDELRRAKHSTMMILFQLHNPAAPLFLQQCGACYRDITHGVRHHCNECSNFDLCQECYEPVTSGLWAKRDSRFEHDKSHTFTPVDMEALGDTEKSRENRQKTLKAHTALLEHAGTCQGAPGCSLQNCQRMKKLLDHVRSCEIKPKTDCRICTRLLSLCAIHARACTVRGTCPVPFCDRIRERNSRIRRQQQLMDDRRRQAQNDLYHAT
jgi:E1A/CREB-binding protein